MKAMSVQYTVKPAYTEHNKANVRAVMDDLRKHSIEGMSYAIFYLSDGKFMHLNVSNTETANAKLNERESFKSFISQLKGSEPLVAPKPENLELIGSSKDLLI